MIPLHQAKTVTRQAQQNNFAWPHQVFLSFWTHRVLIKQLTKREIAKRYRGSVLGLVWAMAYPILILAIYTFVFRVIFKVKWDQADSNVEYALVLFTGLLVYNFFSESVGSAPALMQSHVSFVKKVMFPLETLSWVVVGNALFHAAVSLLVLVVGLLVIHQHVPLTIVLLPVIFIPLILLTVGFVWFVASLAVYIKDVGQVVSVTLILLMFVSPILYPMSAVPESIAPYMFLNPLAPILVQAQNVCVFGRMPDWNAWCLVTAITGVLAWLGYLWFQKTRAGFADVL